VAGENMEQSGPSSQGEDIEITQASYQETKYEDASWEIVGTFDGEEAFTPMELSVIDGGEIGVDRMFADYGGLPPEGSVRRWHLPDQLAYTPPVSEEEEEVVDNTIHIQPEELQRMLAEAEANGRQAGLEESVTINLEKMKQMEEAMTAIVLDLQKQFSENLTHIESEAVGLALNISRKVISFAVEINPEYIVQILHEAIGHCGGARVKKVRVSPDDMEFIKVVGVEKRLKEFDGSWHFEKDDTIRSGCVVESSAGDLDYQLDQAWERIKENVVRVLR
jgi:flagellar biosynthesis/type III secretory pathway protein FliH